jgi:hypothetical protein
MSEWTRARVQDRLESAADVLRQMPSVRPRGYFNAWPEYFYSFADQVGQEPELKRPRPSPRAITEADDALRWLMRFAGCSGSSPRLPSWSGRGRQAPNGS